MFNFLPEDEEELKLTKEQVKKINAWSSRRKQPSTSRRVAGKEDELTPEQLYRIIACSSRGKKPSTSNMAKKRPRVKADNAEPEVIVLSDSESEDEATSPLASFNVEAYRAEHEVLFGYVNAQVVGLRYYSGKVHR